MLDDPDRPGQETSIVPFVERSQHSPA
ncbi:hypothetical protein [Sodalis-like endosymbiont of Proechinophthirus fluctus]|nr:hypothetical protein [Sodalis-like endosymbiont of Proechinophthirus fluctus]